jgi:hypothetical protein
MIDDTNHSIDKKRRKKRTNVTKNGKDANKPIKERTRLNALNIN